MHADEVETGAALVGRLLASQFPQWADLPIQPVQSAGTDNALYRLGDELVVRMPRIHWALDQIDRERQWLPRLAPHLPLVVPLQLAVGEPGEGYPWMWAVYRWLEGENLNFDQVPDPIQAALDLAGFLRALQGIDPAGGPPPGPHDLARGQPLHRRDTSTREAIAALGGMVEAQVVTAAWEASLQAPDWDGAPVWFHGDMLPGDLLFFADSLSSRT